MAELDNSTDSDSDTNPAVQEPTVVQYKDVAAAAYRIKKGVRETPLGVHNRVVTRPRLVEVII